MKCKLCQERGKTWQGDDPKCAFPEGIFDESNWNCATMNKLRNLAERYGNYEWQEDMNIASLKLNTDDYLGWVVLTWYKSRGRTGTASYITDDRVEPLTIRKAEACLKVYKELAK